MNTKQKISELITVDEINRWENGKAVLIDAPTGAGKSYFIRTNLYEYAKLSNKTILFLSNRNILKAQTTEDTIDLDRNVIKIMNYQALETLSLKKDVDLDKYDYVVADECHYFFADAQFNNRTDLALDILMSLSQSVLILMSATLDLTKRHFKDIIEHSYKIEQDYSYVKSLYFYNSDNIIERMLSDLPKDEKAIYFTGAKQAYQTNKILNDSSFICSEYNKAHGRYSNLEEKQNIITNNKFNSQVLCCTTVLDNGVNIIDPEVKTIVIDVFDIDTLQQCLGRKRIVGDESITLYIKNWNNNRVGGIQTKVSSLIEKVRFLKEKGEDAFLEEYRKDTYSELIDIVKDGDETKLVINNAMYIKHLHTSLICWSVLQMGNSGYKAFIMERLNIDYNIARNLDKFYECKEVSDVLDNMIGEKIYKKQQKILIETIDFRVNGRVQRSYKKLNYALKEVLKLNYAIKPIRGKSYRDEDGKVKTGKSYWVIGTMEFPAIKL